MASGNIQNEALCGSCRKGFKDTIKPIVCKTEGCNNIAHENCISSSETTIMCVVNGKISFLCHGCQRGYMNGDGDNVDDADVLKFVNEVDEVPSGGDAIGGKPLNENSLVSDASLKGSGYKFCHWNVQGIRNKFGTVKHYLEENKDIAVFGITETKLGPGTTLEFIKDYDLKRFDNEEDGNAKRGQVVYINTTNFTYTEVDADVNPPHRLRNMIECNIFQLTRRGTKFEAIVCILYVHPDVIHKNVVDRGCFFAYFEHICAFLKKMEKRVIIMGDFNINLDPKASRPSKSAKMLRNVTDDFCQLVEGYTFRKGDYRSLLDHIYVDGTHYDKNRYVCKVVEFPSDHSLTYLCVSNSGFKKQ